MQTGHRAGYFQVLTAVAAKQYALHSSQRLSPLKDTLCMIEFFDPPDPDAARPFSRATRAAGLVFVSGHSAPHDPTQGIHRGETAGEEVRNALGLIQRVLQNAGSDLDRVVQMTMLITDPADYAACNAEYVKHFPAGLPARHTARFGVPTDAKVAFACIALASDD
jgi:2-iminobutanoate/2-iminopropanoate deaminase